MKRSKKNWEGGGKESISFSFPIEFLVVLVDVSCIGPPNASCPKLLSVFTTMKGLRNKVKQSLPLLTHRQHYDPLSSTSLSCEHYSDMLTCTEKWLIFLNFQFCKFTY